MIKALLILAIISFLLFLIANIWIRIIISYDDKFSLKLKILFLSFTIYPKKEKKIDPRKFTLKRFKKRRIKEEKKYLKKLKDNKSSKNEKKSEDTKKNVSTHRSAKETASYAMTFLKDVVIRIVKKTAKYLRVDISEFRIIVSGEDAAKIAIEYGAVSQAVGYIIALLDSLKHTRYTKNAVVQISCDFVSGKSDVMALIGFRLKLWHLIAIAVDGIKGYLKI